MHRRARVDRCQAPVLGPIEDWSKRSSHRFQATSNSDGRTGSSSGLIDWLDPPRVAGLSALFQDLGVSYKETMKLSLLRKTDLAIRALRALAESGTRVKAGDLGRRTGASPRFVPHVMAPLTKAGWVDSGRGPTGGYRLRVPLGEISVLEVIEAVEGRVDTTICVLRDGPCGPSEHCSVHFPVQEATTALLARLANVPVGSKNDKESAT